MVNVTSPGSRSSVFLNKMPGSSLPIAVAHGEGRAVFVYKQHQQSPEARSILTGVLKVFLVCRVGTGGVPHPERTVPGGTGSWLDERVGWSLDWAVQGS